MQLNFEERKLMLIKQLEEAYADKPGEWWKSGSVRYELTAVAAMRSKWVFAGNTTTILKYNFRKKWYEFAFVVAMLALILSAAYWGKATITYQVWIVVALMLLFPVYPLLKKQNRLPGMMLTNKGIWIEPLEDTIPWEYVAASYIKHDNRGEDANDYLVLHYYEAGKDVFSVAEYLLDDVKVLPVDLAAEIEFRKKK